MLISKEILDYELSCASKLGNKHRGELAELVFMRKAAAFGFVVAKPWGDSERYDFIVRSHKSFWRVQVKSVRAMSPHKHYYRVRTVNWLRVPYSAAEIDFLVAYIFPEDTWYIFPASVVENKKSLCVTPQSKRSTFEQYREAWELMGQGRGGPDPVKDGNVKLKSTQNESGGDLKP